MQFKKNKNQTICSKNDSKLRKEKVVTCHKFLYSANAIERPLHKNEVSH